MVRPLSKTLAILLVGTMCVLHAAALSLPVPTAKVASAGCHGHTKPAPKPAHADYFCCQVGHNAVMLQNEFKLIPLAAEIQRNIETEKLVALLPPNHIFLPPHFADPPTLISLRI